jgi:hypothetical protein
MPKKKKKQSSKGKWGRGMRKIFVLDHTNMLWPSAGNYTIPLFTTHIGLAHEKLHKQNPPFITHIGFAHFPWEITQTLFSSPTLALHTSHGKIHKPYFHRLHSLRALLTFVHFGPHLSLHLPDIPTFTNRNSLRTPPFRGIIMPL